LFDIPNFYTNQAKPDGLGYGWYIRRLKECVDLAHEESGGERAILLAHSAGGWLARAAMGNGVWCEQNGVEVKTSDRISALVTLGAIHRVPENEKSCVTRGALQYVESQYPGAFLTGEGIKYVSVGGNAIVGDKDADDTLTTANDVVNDIDKSTTSSLERLDKVYAKRGEGSASRVAYTAYESVCGKGGVVGDGVVPLGWALLEGSKQIKLDGVLHSINEAGTTIPTDRWYGSDGVIDRWLPAVLNEVGLVENNNNSNERKFSEFQQLVSNLFSFPISRGTFVQALSSVALGSTGTAFSFSQSASAMYDNAPAVDSQPVKLSSGVTIQDMRQGNGDVVIDGKRVNIQWVMKRSNGYSIDSSAENDGVPFIFIVGSSSAIRGLDEGIRGMRVGGVRRIIIPPSLAFVEGVEDGKPGPIPPGFGPKQRIRRVMELRKDVPGESFILDIKPTRVM